MLLAMIQEQPAFRFQGEIAALSAALLWAGSVNVFRHFGHRIPPHTLNCLKSIVGVTGYCTCVILVRPAMPVDMGLWGLFAVSGLIGLALGDTAFFAGLKRLGAQMASAGLCLAPVFTVFIAWGVLNEVPNLAESVGIYCIVVALGGCVYYGKKSGSTISHLSPRALLVGLALILVAALAQATGLVIARKAFQQVHVLWGSLIRMTPALLFLLFVQGLHQPRQAVASFKKKKWALPALVTASFFGTFLGVLLQSVGTKYAKAGVTQALLSTFPLWVIPISRIFLKEKTNWQSILCILLAVGGICFMSLYNYFLLFYAKLFL